MNSQFKLQYSLRCHTIYKPLFEFQLAAEQERTRRELYYEDLRRSALSGNGRSYDSSSRRDRFKSQRDDNFETRTSRDNCYQSGSSSSDFARSKGSLNYESSLSSQEQYRPSRVSDSSQAMSSRDRYGTSSMRDRYDTYEQDSYDSAQYNRRDSSQYSNSQYIDNAAEGTDIAGNPSLL